MATVCRRERARHAAGVPGRGAVRSRRRLPLARRPSSAPSPDRRRVRRRAGRRPSGARRAGTAGGTGRRGGGVAVQQVESDFFQPVVVERSVHVHPVTGRDPPRGDGRSRAGRHHRRDHRHADRRASRRPCCATFASSDLRARTPPAENRSLRELSPLSHGRAPGIRRRRARAGARHGRLRRRRPPAAPLRDPRLWRRRAAVRRRPDPPATAARTRPPADPA